MSQYCLPVIRDLHYEDPEAQKESRLTCEDHKLLIGSLEYKAKRCGALCESTFVAASCASNLFILVYCYPFPPAGTAFEGLLRCCVITLFFI